MAQLTVKSKIAIIKQKRGRFAKAIKIIKYTKRAKVLSSYINCIVIKTIHSLLLAFWSVFFLVIH